MKFGGWNPCTIIDYPEKTACMIYTIGCNFRCPYCHNPELVDETVEKEYDENFILDFIMKRREILDGLVITGGEPTIHGESLLAFMRRVKDQDFLVKLDTNGTSPDFIKKAVTLGVVDYVAMDIKSPLENYHKTAGRPVNTEAIKESIQYLISSNLSYEFRTTVVRTLLTPSDLEKIFREIAGAKKYYLQKFRPTKILNPQFKKKTTYSDVEFMDFQRIAEKYVDYCGIR